jgi:hypothetical protein
MAWNEPGNGKDPWSRGDKEPNDLDQIVQNWQRRLSRAVFSVAAEAAARPVVQEATS